jgi:hypothetical protein
MNTEYTYGDVLEALTFRFRSAAGEIQTGDPVPRLCVEELETQDEELYFWRLKGGRTGGSSSIDGPVVVVD